MANLLCIIVSIVTINEMHILYIQFGGMSHKCIDAATIKPYIIMFIIQLSIQTEWDITNMGLEGDQWSVDLDLAPNNISNLNCVILFV